MCGWILWNIAIVYNMAEMTEIEFADNEIVILVNSKKELIIIVKANIDQQEV